MYIGLILVEQNGENYLFRAPSWHSINIGDQVVVEGNRTGTVVDTVSGISTNDSLYEFIVSTANAKTPLPKVLGKLEYVEMRYFKEEEENGEHSEK